MSEPDGTTERDRSSPTVSASVVLPTTADQAFSLFVHQMHRWWDPDQHVLSAPVAEMVVEPRVGGRVFDRGVDGSLSQWGTVLVYDPPVRFSFLWHVTPLWTLDPKPARSSEVEVTFVPLDQGGVRVDLEHRHLDRHGEGWERLRDAVSAPESWPAGLQRLATLADVSN